MGWGSVSGSIYRRRSHGTEDAAQPDAAIGLFRIHKPSGPSLTEFSCSA